MKKPRRTIIIGLTGGIGMGKSTAAQILRRMGLPVYHADRAVHKLLRRGGKAVKPVGKLFPETLKRGAIDRKLLGALVFGDARKLGKLEAVLHPLVRRAEQDFLKKARRGKARAAVLEIPLLFETGGEKRCDTVLCVTAPTKIQRARVLARPGMTAAKFRAILRRQMPDRIKRARADYVIRTGNGYADTQKQLRRILKKLLED